MRLFVVVMAVGRKDIYMDFSLKDLIDKSVFPRYLPAPLSTTVTLQRFWMARACTGMMHQFVNQLNSFIKSRWFATAQLCQIYFGLLRINDVIHISKRVKPCIHFFWIGKALAFALPDFLTSLIHTGKEFLFRHQCGVFLFFYQFLGIPGQAPHQRLAICYSTDALPEFCVHCVQLYCCHNTNFLIRLQK